MGFSYKIGAIIFIVTCISVFETVNAQYKYSIDINPVKGQRVSLKFTVLNAKENFKTSSEYRKIKRIEKKTSKKIRNHIYKIQTHEVKKRMRKSRKKAENYNREKVPLSVKLKNILNG